MRGNIPNKIVLTVWPPNFWAGYATGFIERLLRTAQNVLGRRMRLPKMWNLLVVQHLKWLWRHVWNVYCCGQFGGGEIGV